MALRSSANLVASPLRVHIVNNPISELFFLWSLSRSSATKNHIVTLEPPYKAVFLPHIDSVTSKYEELSLYDALSRCRAASSLTIFLTSRNSCSMPFLRYANWSCLYFVEEGFGAVNSDRFSSFLSNLKTYSRFIVSFLIKPSRFDNIWLLPFNPYVSFFFAIRSFLFRRTVNFLAVNPVAFAGLTLRSNLSIVPASEITTILSQALCNSNRFSDRLFKAVSLNQDFSSIFLIPPYADVVRYCKSNLGFFVKLVERRTSLLLNCGYEVAIKFHPREQPLGIVLWEELLDLDCRVLRLSVNMPSEYFYTRCKFVFTHGSSVILYSHLLSLRDPSASFFVVEDIWLFSASPYYYGQLHNSLRPCLNFLKSLILCDSLHESFLVDNLILPSAIKP